MIISTIWLGIIGFLDDYLKLRRRELQRIRECPIKKVIKMDWQDG